MRVLVCGWFSFDEVVATVGDERAADVVVEWLSAAAVPHDVAWASWMRRGPSLTERDPDDYSHLLLVCGPLIDARLVHDLLDRYDHAQRLAVGVSVVDPVITRRFHRVWARDGLRSGGLPDLALVPAPVSPLVLATVFAPLQPEYGDRSRHDEVRSSVERWIACRRHGWFDVATDLLTDSGQARHVSQVSAALTRADVVVTTRLHGLVLAIAASCPVVAIDPVSAGAKVTAQAAALGWPVVLGPADLTPERLDAALHDACRQHDRSAEQNRAGALDQVHQQLVSELMR